MRKTLLFKPHWLLAALCFPVFSLSQVHEDWVSRYTGDKNAPDRANALALDDNGNIYVTGYSTITGQGLNFFTLRYSPNGRVKWQKNYNGAANGDDEATDIAVDRFDNIYVAGKSTGIGTNSDFTIIKYDNRGNTKWVRIYNGPGNGIDEPTAVAVDFDGNVYVTGSSWGIGNNIDYATLKYNKNGRLEWVARYDNGDFDRANDIAVDAAGNVYVTGESDGSKSNFDYATIKYSLNGEQQWIRRYDAANLSDVANAIAVDDAGNVYVTGASTSRGDADEDIFFIDFATIKYNSDGRRLWVKRYDRQRNDQANALKLDKEGNVYVTGSSGTYEEDPDNDFATVKYNASGVQQWAAVFEDPELSEGGGAVALELDRWGNVYVAGRNEEDYVTIKYNAGGTQQWLQRFDGPGNDYDFLTDLAVDRKGNAYVTGSSRITSIGGHDDYATIKYNTDGKTEWVRNYNSPSDEYAGLPDGAVDIALTTDGKIYVTGSSTHNATGLDYTTILYNSNGSPRWTKHYNGEGNGNDQAQAMAVDIAGNVYVTGWSQGNGTNRDFATVKYDRDGTVRWVKRFDGNGMEDVASDVAVDLFGNVYVTGWSQISRTNTDFTIIKYNKNGKTIWIKHYNGPGNGMDKGRAIAVDFFGNVYVTGESLGDATGNDYATIKYNRNGSKEWVARYNGPTNGFDEATNLALDFKGNVYVTGGSSEGVTAGIATVKYNNNGVQQWAARRNNGSSKEIAVDARGNAYIIANNIVIKYNPKGTELWSSSFAGETAALAIDREGNVFVSGWSYTDSTNIDYATTRFDKNGVEQWTITYNGPGNWSDNATAIALDHAGNVYVTGRSTGAGTDDDYATIKYAQSYQFITKTEKEEEPAEPVRESFRAYHAPNPVVHNASIYYELPEDGNVSIVLYDAMGRQVARLVNASYKAGRYSINYDASRLQNGVYYYQVRFNTPKKQWLQTHKMSVMR